MNHLLRYFILTLICLCSFQFNYAQPTVADTLNANDLAQYFIGLNLSISNVTLNCAAGASGTFEASSSNLGIDTGIILTSGSINNLIGPNIIGSSTMNNSFPGDPDLDALLPGFTTNDACILEFDLIPNSSVLYFRYVFASEEYPEFVNSSFNDVFAFFISGPGLTGAQNIAQVPGTTIPVAINNVNNGNTNCPGGPIGPCTNCAYYVDNCGGATIEYDGFTTVITASIGNLVPTGTYHLKLSVADAGDFILDSGVMLEAATNDTSVISCKPPKSPQTNFMNSNTVDLNWDAVAGADRYLVRGNVVGGSGFVFEQAAIGASSLRVENLAYNTDYFWQVQSICETNLDFPSSPFTQSQIFTTGGFCERPVGLSANGIQPTAVMLNWTQVSGAVSYVIKGRAVGSSTIATLDGITNNFLAVNNLSPGTSYEWVVKAVCTGANSSSEFSSIHTFATTNPSAKQSPAVNNFDLSAIKLYPNPAMDQVNIQLPSFESAELIQVRIYHHDGRLVLSEEIASQSNLHTVRLPGDLDSGVYNLQVSVDNVIQNLKLVLVR